MKVLRSSEMLVTVQPATQKTNLQFHPPASSQPVSAGLDIDFVVLEPSGGCASFLFVDPQDGFVSPS